MNKDERREERAASTRAGENIAIVLCRPAGAGNIGSVARALGNTGFSSLSLVSPVDYRNDEAYSMACKASDILLGAKVFDRLDDAVKESSFVLGATRRDGKGRSPLLSLDEAVVMAQGRAALNRVAIVFGSERNGLDNDEIALCDMLFEIPTSENYPSLNLSHAVFAFCHKLFSSAIESEPTVEFAPREEVLEMFAHLEQALRSIEYGEQGGEHLLASIMRNFRRLFARTGLMQKEVNMLRGIFTQIIERRGRKAESEEAGEPTTGKRTGSPSTVRTGT